MLVYILRLVTRLVLQLSCVFLQLDKDNSAVPSAFYKSISTAPQWEIWAPVNRSAWLTAVLVLSAGWCYKVWQSESFTAVLNRAHIPTYHFQTNYLIWNLFIHIATLFTCLVLCCLKTWFPRSSMLFFAYEFSDYKSQDLQRLHLNTPCSSEACLAIWHAVLLSLAIFSKWLSTVAGRVQGKIIVNWTEYVDLERNKQNCRTCMWICISFIQISSFSCAFVQ